MSVHPVVLAMIAAKGLTVPHGHVTIDDITASSGGYFERMKLFEMLGVKSGIHVTESDPSGRFIPLSQVRTADEQSRFITNVIPLLHLQPEQAEVLRYILSELIRNVLEHSDSSHGAIVAAQYHKKSNIVRLGIADTGLGIKTTINHSHSAWSDLDAIKLALTPGITGTTNREGGTFNNAGAGLFFIKSIAATSRNFFMMYSGDALYKLLKQPALKAVKLCADPDRDRHSEKVNLPYWQGTVVGIDLSLDSTVAFATLLSELRQTHSLAVRERRKARYKKVRFEP
jgi:anti-sigma regulatory factor (Ser/Thr protein kinase)